mmetsp:Transcript_12109/g.37571  ORF Transcript_12109/g.37571 Transcript_12109/m.37571 type:complete len:293 (+) Transcript_12109:119-997(+)
METEPAPGSPGKAKEPTGGAGGSPDWQQAEWDDRSWPRGTTVTHEGRLGRLATAPDKRGEVRLEWPDGSKSGFVPLSALRRASAADWEEARREEDEARQRQEIANKAKEPPSGAPPPRGVAGPVALASEADLKVAFEMLDERREGALDRAQARNWLRCAGWCLPDEDLDEMLGCVSAPRGLPRSSTQLGRTKWGLKTLVEILAKNRDRENSSVEALQAALRRLAHNRAKIPRERLLELTTQGTDLTEANLNEVLSSLGLASAGMLDCDALATRMLERVCHPPSVLDMNSFRG